MIAHVRGEVAEKFAGRMIIDVAGVGYEVQVALGDYDSATLGDAVKLHTYHHIREQSQDLFGFSSLAAKKLFELLITVQSVGPKAALAILSLGEAENMRNAIAGGDAAFIAKASGVGKKTAERIVVDLADKVGLPTQYGRKADMPDAPFVSNDEALDALMALGFSLNDASSALEGVEPTLDVGERVKLALKNNGAK